MVSPEFDLFEGKEVENASPFCTLITEIVDSYAHTNKRKHTYTNTRDSTNVNAIKIGTTMQ